MQEADTSYQSEIDPASMVISPQAKPMLESETKELGKAGDPRGGPSQLASDTVTYGTETPYRKTPPTNIGSVAEKAATSTPPTGAGVSQADADDNALPANTVAPVVSGTLTSGSVLTCTPGTYVPASTSNAFQWYYSTGAAIAGATANTRTLVAGDVGKNLYCVVTPSTVNGFGAPATSNTVGPIA